MMAERSDVDKLKNTFYVIRHGEVYLYDDITK